MIGVDALGQGRSEGYNIQVPGIFMGDGIEHKVWGSTNTFLKYWAWDLMYLLKGVEADAVFGFFGGGLSTFMAVGELWRQYSTEPAFGWSPFKLSVALNSPLFGVKLPWVVSRALYGFGGPSEWLFTTLLRLNLDFKAHFSWLKDMYKLFSFRTYKKLKESTTPLETNDRIFLADMESPFMSKTFPTGIMLQALLQTLRAVAARDLRLGVVPRVRP